MTDLDSTLEQGSRPWRWYHFFWRPYHVPGCSPGEAGSTAGARVLRFYALLGFWNNLLLSPLVTYMVLDMFGGDGMGDLPHSDETLAIVCLFFGAEWLLGVALATDRRAFLWNFWNLLDLLSAIPFGWLFQTGRFARLGRLTRTFRFLRYRKLTKAARLARALRLGMDLRRLARAALIVLSVTLSGAIAIQMVEPGLVDGYVDALWWSLITVSTVGYGDIAPATVPGRMVGGVLVFFGIGVFGFVAGLMTAALRHPDDLESDGQVLQAMEAMEARLLVRLDQLQASLSEERG